MTAATDNGDSILDLFAGPGGWDEGLATLGLEALGVDDNTAACETAEAAGHRRLLGDVAALDPADFEPLGGLIASPPCQAYSSAGKGLGKLDKPQVVACAAELSRGRDTRARRLGRCRDPRSILTVEPLRFAFALRPRWIAFEQVPAVAELWAGFAELLEDCGYHAAVGTLSAEQFGVPQVRKRAFLIASLDGPVTLPSPTHRSFHPRRHEPLEEERDLLPWVSMAKALGWGSEPALLRSSNTRSGQVPEGLARSLDRPSYTIVSTSSNWRIEFASQPAGDAPPARLPVDCARHERRRRARQKESEGRPEWTGHRPATTLLGDPRITAPGSWPRVGRRAAIVRGRPVRVSFEQAAVLQGFRHDYPWQGTRSQRFQQIGNAVCPPVAALVLAEAIRPSKGRAGGRRG